MTKPVTLVIGVWVQISEFRRDSNRSEMDRLAAIAATEEEGGLFISTKGTYHLLSCYTTTQEQPRSLLGSWPFSMN